MHGELGFISMVAAMFGGGLLFIAGLFAILVWAAHGVSRIVKWAMRSNA
jgi:low affinity Fe/Cu permease